MSALLLPGSEERNATPIRRLPAGDHLVSDAEYRRMRATLTDIAALGIAVRANVTKEELRDLVADVVRRALGVTP